LFVASWADRNRPITISSPDWAACNACTRRTSMRVAANWLSTIGVSTALSVTATSVMSIASGIEPVSSRHRSVLM
jgi:hypothetical protein